MSKRRSEIPDINSLKRLKVADLKQLCDTCGLGKQGLKNDLVSRLDQAREAPATSSRTDADGIAKPSSSNTAKGAHVVDSRQATPVQKVSQVPVTDKRQRAMKLFAKYACDEDPNKITMEGFVRFGQDLAGGNEEESVTPRHSFFMFFLSWKMKSTSFAEITKEGFVSGLDAMQCFSVEELIAKRDALLSEVANHRGDPQSNFDPNERFVAMYTSIFDILKPEGKKYVEKDMAIEAFQALFQGLPGRGSQHADLFLRFLREKETLGSLNADQWRGFLSFSREVDSGFGGYSDCDPWPSLLDDFVSWCKAHPDWQAKHGKPS